MQIQQRLTKRERQAVLIEILERQRAANQTELISLLEARGVSSTQATVSRDLADLGVVKVGGRYRLPRIRPSQSSLEGLEVKTAGDNLIVVRTGPGRASLAAFQIDGSRLPEVVGTVAGDDTVLVAVKGGLQQSQAVKKIMSLFAS